ncbi:glycosyltransferase family 4 protein [Segetibacter aerophilus]|uniref:Glycosyl transferase n=1 Tax=Segetibacter aerophilus TaxID=670293 RepID=A0A512BII2_9BACT|nr:glycosyltransferase family 4 protein [Segetibacter aerophilus]GEO11627.1 glycosyl transferase [Segetibacter aerophilus]
MTSFYGGGEEYIVRLVTCLQDDFDIKLICCSKLLGSKLREHRLQIQLVTGSTPATYLRIFYRILSLPQKGQQVLLLNGQGPVYFALFLPRAFKKLVYVHHTSIEYYNKPTKQKFVIHCLRKVGTVICVSNFLKNEVDKYIKNKLVKVIYNWLPADAVRPIDYPVKDPWLRIIFIARLVEVKGILPLIEVVIELANVELSILGDGPLYEQIKSNYGSYSNIKLLGWQNDKAAFFQRSHLNVVNSFSEGYSYTPVEAGVCGIPSLISDLEVHREISDNGKYAFLFKTGSKEDLKAKLIYLRDHRNELVKMSEECRIYFTNKFVYSDYKEQYKKELT